MSEETHSDLDLRVRVLKVAMGAHFLSFVARSDAPTLAQELERRLDGSTDLVINADGLGVGGAFAVAALLRTSQRVAAAPGRVVVVCEDAAIREAFRLSGIPRGVLIESSFGDALRYVLARTWLEKLYSLDQTGISL
jgi:anti-anti-sigma regulatory factor